MTITDIDVAIVGGGPFGLMLANELGRRGVKVELFEQNPGTASYPKANATQARTMEHYRRLGFVEEIRSLGLPEDYPTDIAFFTRFTKHELARFHLPTAREARQKIANLSGSWSAAELPHRIAQMYVEQVLRSHAEKLDGISINFGWRVVEFLENENHVHVVAEEVGGTAKREFRATYLVGADGVNSLVRKQLGFDYVGDTGVIRDFLGGRMYTIYLHAPKFYEQVPHDPAWMNIAFNSERRALLMAVDGRGEFTLHIQLKENEKEDNISDGDALKMFQETVGFPIEAQIVAHMGWTAGLALVTDGYQKGRVFIGGDAAHLFTPTGGLGYNTAVEDAVNLGWKMASVVKGIAGTGLLDSYEVERQPLAVRNTTYAKELADSHGCFLPEEGLEEETENGAAIRSKAGTYLEGHAKREFNIPGITFGSRYDGSPVIIPDGTSPPPDSANKYIPTACPGGRAPHMWLGEGRSLFDEFGFEWTLLRLGRKSPNGEKFQEVAMAAGLDLKVIELPSKDARDLYESSLALIRPDQVVAWRGEDEADAEEIIARIMGL